MLAQPQETLELQHKQAKAVATTCLTFPQNDVNNFLVGSEEGNIYTACRHGSRAGVLDVFEGHQAPVTGIDTHNGQGHLDFSHLFLSSSIDWTVKLWSLKENKPFVNLCGEQRGGTKPPLQITDILEKNTFFPILFLFSLSFFPPKSLRGGGDNVRAPFVPP